VRKGILAPGGKPPVNKVHLMSAKVGLAKSRELNLRHAGLREMNLGVLVVAKPHAEFCTEFG